MKKRDTARITGDLPHVQRFGVILQTMGYRYDRPIRRRFWLFGPYIATFTKNPKCPASESAKTSS